MPDDPSKGPPFSESVRVGNTVYVSGQMGLDRSGQPPENVSAEARLVLENVRDVLGRQKMTMDDLAMVTIHAPEAARDFPAFNEVYVKFFNEPYPARAFIGSGTLLNRRARFYVTAIAAKPKT